VAFRPLGLTHKRQASCGFPLRQKAEPRSPSWSLVVPVVTGPSSSGNALGSTGSAGGPPGTWYLAFRQPSGFWSPQTLPSSAHRVLPGGLPATGLLNGPGLPLRRDFSAPH